MIRKQSYVEIFGALLTKELILDPNISAISISQVFGNPFASLRKAPKVEISSAPWGVPYSEGAMYFIKFSPIS